ncbi:hypothetical protein SAMN04488009_1733 [Maribacter sedimenticola]|uniref:Lipoprotein n=1 Tax=Maribacter sedimenticola TaxID=228956 RepID=A0ABY1SG12_9FLAO|nr:hypothetical protein [Maribacter sedimenticola]SNR43942.1 hypothetical protein SAMN04488009_1733 [Maribacter sedimenticola]
MIKRLLITLLTTVLLFSCKQEHKNEFTPKSLANTTLTSTASNENKKIQLDSIAAWIDTTYLYTITKGKQIIVQNSLPKGGLTYTFSNGQKFVYGIFWSRIINTTETPFELSVKMPKTSIPQGTSFDNSLNVLLPNATMRIDKVPLFNYGLTDLAAALENTLQKPTLLKLTIPPKETNIFYVITLFKKGLNDKVRAGFFFKDNKAWYRVNDTEIPCGLVYPENLVSRH